MFAAILITVLSAVLWDGKAFAFTSFAMAFAACFPFFVSFENKKTKTGLVVLTAVMTAVSVAGRFLFAPLPFFKPVTAIVTIAAMSLGRQSGFVIGAFSAAISNFYFGQGPWTPFQMLAWGLIGYGAGALSKPLKSSKIALSVYGIVAGVAYSLVMDGWSTVWLDGHFSAARFGALVVSAAPVTACYAVSNVIFLLLLGKPLGNALERIVKKYGLDLEE